MESRWNDADAAAFVERCSGRAGAELALRVYSSRLLGSDGALVLHGGGNTSLKATAREITGEPVEVLYVKGSGWDLASIEPEGFPACRLEPLRRACRLETLSDDDMVKLLRSQMLDPASPTPSVEALLHAWLDARYVDHTHADAVLAVVDQPDGEKRARQVWPSGLVFVPYVMPGFALAKKMVELGDVFRSARVMVLDKHGIFTWGDSARESYERMIECVNAAERWLKLRASTVTLKPRAWLAPEERQRRQRALTPTVRGALSRADDGARLILEWRDEPAIIELVGRDDGPRLSAIGPVTPDHVIRTKPVPAWLESAGEPELDREAIRSQAEAQLSAFAKNYEAYFERCSKARGRTPIRLDRLPRVLLVPGLGALVIGKTLREARVAGDIYSHTASVILAAVSSGQYRPVGELDLFDVEYWSLEQQKLKLGKSTAGPLERQIAVVTGAASGIGRATAEHLLALGAHVVLGDRNQAALEGTLSELARRFGPQVAADVGDVTLEADVKRLIVRAVDTFGGLDIVVSNAGTAPSGALHSAEGDARLRESLEVNLLGHQRVARAAVEVMLAQGIGGCLLFNASKSAFGPGPDFGPYAVPKAAVIALMRQYAIDLGAHGIRSNAVNADRIRTELFSGGVLETRAKARGVSPDEYFRQNLLRRETTASDVARAFGWLATAEATTGAVVTVDGGNPGAFPR